MQRIYAPKYVKTPIFTDSTIFTDSKASLACGPPTHPSPFQVAIRYVGDSNLADLMTKPITGSRFYALRARVLGLPT